MDKCADSNANQDIGSDFLSCRHDLLPGKFHAVLEMKFFLGRIQRSPIANKILHLIFKMHFLDQSTANYGNHQSQNDINDGNLPAENTHK